MDTEKAEQEKQFISRIFIDEIGRLQKEKFYFFSFILIGQAIETLGCFLDNKPVKARSQSTKRFSKALKILLGARYGKVNADNWLFDKLRSQLTHSFMPSKSLLLTSRSQKPKGVEHLQWIDSRLVLIAEDFYEDMVKGCYKLFKLIDSGEVSSKRVVSNK